MILALPEVIYVDKAGLRLNLFYPHIQIDLHGLGCWPLETEHKKGGSQNPDCHLFYVPFILKPKIVIRELSWDKRPAKFLRL